MSKLFLVFSSIHYLKLTLLSDITDMTIFNHHPKGILTIFLTEMWERFGFYILMAILTLYMDKEFEWSDSCKGNHYSVFLGLVYFFPVLGGWMGDRIAGQINIVKLGALLMLFGYIFLGFSSLENLIYFYTGLFLIAFGTGIFKVNMAVLVGNLYKERPGLKDAGFNIYYMGVNVGALFAPIAATILGNIYNTYHIIFWMAAFGMFLGIVTFVFGQKNLYNIDSKNNNKNKAVKKVIEKDPQDLARIYTLITLLLIIIVFWAGFYQNGFTLTLFAERSTIISKVLRPETYQIFSPLFILIFTPIIVVIFKRMRKKGREPKTPVKIFIGMLIMGIAMAIMVTASYAGGDKDINIMSPWWLISTYLVVTLAEILISPMGMSYVSKVAPKRIEGVMMGFWFGATSLGAIGSGLIGKLYSDMPHHTFFLLLTGLLAFSAILILFVLKKLKNFA